jgi:hypothetical protein
MAQSFISRGFKGRAREANTALKQRIPPGQYETKDFPVLSAGPTPRKDHRGYSLRDDVRGVCLKKSLCRKEAQKLK